MICFVFSVTIITSLFVLVASLWGIYAFVASGGMKRPPMVVTTGKVKKVIIRRVGKRIKKCEVNDFPMPFTIVDAGCGIGTLIIPLAKMFPNHNFVGIEYDYLPYIISKLRARRIKNLKIEHKDIFDYDFKNVTMVICFLLKPMMPMFADKCKQELSKKSYIFSNRFALSDFQPMETIDFNDDFNFVHLYKYLPENLKTKKV